MSGLSVHRITNANIYLDGKNFFAKAEEVTLGDLKAVMSDFQGLGLVGLFELPDGLDKIEGKIVWNSAYPDAGVKMANLLKTIQLQCRSNLQVFNNSGLLKEVPMVTTLTIMSKQYSLGGNKPRDPSKFETPFSVIYLRQQIDGKEIVLVDYLANIYRVDGKDLLNTYRRNIGQL
ncbi:Phage tail tube protein FII [compost metagenome]